MEKFPGSGVICNITGKILYENKQPAQALNAWLDGIQNDPRFDANYYDAASVYLRTKKVEWGILYGEIFLSMAHDTTYDVELKNKLFAGYKVMFENMVKGNAPKYGEVLKHNTANTFMDAVQNVYQSHTPVVSDGITTETLTMLRVRFLMDWFTAHDKKYPFSFFSYQEKLIKNGRFDVYSEWIFGHAESATQYSAWNEYHDGDMDRFLKWRPAHLFVPAGGEFYNDRDMEGLFEKKKK